MLVISALNRNSLTILKELMVKMEKMVRMVQMDHLVQLVTVHTKFG